MNTLQLTDNEMMALNTLMSNMCGEEFDEIHTKIRDRVDSGAYSVAKGYTQETCDARKFVSGISKHEFSHILYTIGDKLDKLNDTE